MRKQYLFTKIFVFRCRQKMFSAPPQYFSPLKISVSDFLPLNNTLFPFFYRFLFYTSNKSSEHSRCHLCLTCPIADGAISFSLIHKTKIRGFLRLNNTFLQIPLYKFDRLHLYDCTASIHYTSYYDYFR